MKPWMKLGLVIVAWVLFGLLRISFESGLNKLLTEQQLLPSKLDVSTTDKIGQTSSAVALGGLRTLVASFLNLRAFGFFTEQKWAEVAQTFEWIVDLAPKTRYYWETGSWHQAYNASSYYLNDSDLPVLRRRQAWKGSILAGREFLERGVRNNPDDWRLWANLGFLLTDPNKFPAFTDRDEAFRQAALAYENADDASQSISYVRRARMYALARVKGEEMAALALARELFKQSRQNQTPSLLCLLFVLESWADPDGSIEDRLDSIFQSKQEAYQMLGQFWMRTRERFPIYGVSGGLEFLERHLKVPSEESIFNRPPPPAWNPLDLLENQ